MRDEGSGGVGRGDGAFRALVTREQPGLVATSAMIVGRRALAEEIVQDALERTYLRWAEVSRLDRPGAWVRRVVVNRSISASRRSGTERRALDRVRGQRVDLTSEPEVPMGELWRAVADLPPSQATAVALHYGADLPVAVIAGELGLTDAAVKALLHRARAALRRQRGIQEMVR